MKPMVKPALMPAPKVEIINLIDVLITLIAFFMFTTVFASRQEQMKIQLPVASQSNSDKATVGIEICLNKGNEIYLAGNKIQSEELLEYLEKNCRSNELVTIKADRDCRYEWVIKLLDMIKSRGLNRVALRVSPR